MIEYSALYSESICCVCNIKKIFVDQSGKMRAWLQRVTRQSTCASGDCVSGQVIRTVAAAIRWRIEAKSSQHDIVCVQRCRAQCWNESNIVHLQLETRQVEKYILCFNKKKKRIFPFFCYATKTIKRLRLSVSWKYRRGIGNVCKFRAY